VTQWEPACASTAASSLETKIRLIKEATYSDVSDIKLKRTDTTLDLSQKAAGIISKYSSDSRKLGRRKTYQRELKKKVRDGAEGGVYIGGELQGNESIFTDARAQGSGYFSQELGAVAQVFDSSRRMIAFLVVHVAPCP